MLLSLKRYFYLLLVCFYLPLSAVVLDSSGNVLPEVKEIFLTFEPLMSEPQKALLSAPNLENLNTLAQQLFLRPAGNERKDITQQSPLSAYASEKIAHHFKTIGDIGAVLPATAAYDYILFNGATVQNMRQRLATLIELVETGTLQIKGSTQIVLLTGDRDLFQKESREVLLDCAPLSQEPSWSPKEPWPSSEADALVWIFEQTQLPSSFKTMPLVLVRAPKNQKVELSGEISYVRPTTQDTVRCWFQQFHPTPGKCLVISSQPFVYYQELTTRHCMAVLDEKGFEVSGAGQDQLKAEQFQKNLPVYLDNLARTLYTELAFKRVQ